MIFRYQFLSNDYAGYDINFHFLSLLPFFTDLSAGLAKASHEGKYIHFLYNLLYI